MSCANHSDKPGQFQCISCKIVLCNQCVKSFQAGGFFTYFCPVCNSQCEEIDEKQSPASASPPPPPEGKKKIPIPAPEKIIEPSEPEPSQETVELPQPAATEKDTPSSKPELTIPPEGRKIIRLETDDLDAMPVTAAKISESLSPKTPSILERPAVSAEIKTPSFLGYFLFLIFKPGKVFRTMAVQMQKSMPLKIQSLLTILTFLFLMIFIRFQNHPFTFSLISSLTDTVLFLFFFSLFSTPTEEIKSKVNLGMSAITLFTFIHTLHIWTLHFLTSLNMNDYTLYAGLGFVVLKLWVIFRGLRSFNDKGAFQNLLYVLIILLSQWFSESAFFKWFYL